LQRRREMAERVAMAGRGRGQGVCSFRRLGLGECRREGNLSLSRSLTRDFWHLFKKLTWVRGKDEKAEMEKIVEV